MFGVSPRTWAAWVTLGRITCGRPHRRPGDGHTCILYREAELRRLHDDLERPAGKPYPDTDHAGVWRVPLKGFGIDRQALIDEADLPIVEGVGRSWAERSDGKGGWVVLAINGRQRPLHRLILGLGETAVGGDPAAAGRAARVSFANGDPLDCRRANLVVRTQAEVAHATRPVAMRNGKVCRSAFKGVIHNKKCGKWVAKIRRGALEAMIGAFDDELAAARAYDDCARVWFGAHGWLNFPDRPSSDPERLRAEGVLAHAARRQRRRARSVKRLARLLKRDARAGASKAISKAATAAAAGSSETADLPAVEGPTIGSDEARKLLGVPRETWRRWETRRRIPLGRIADDGRKIYPFAQIKRLLEACGRLRPPYPDPERGTLWRVPLVGRGMGGRREALIDASSLPIIEGGWCGMSGMRDEAGKDAYVGLWSPASRQYLPLRRLIAGVTDDDLRVGHLNDDALDCRRANLVVASIAQRTYRKRRITSINGRPTSSQFKGVSWHKRGGKWMAMITRDGKVRYLGLHAREEDAARAYDCAARDLFGEHARLNFPDPPDAAPEVGMPPLAPARRNAA
jgi:hypothetical protein